MAIRYSGDVEVRLAWNARKRLYVGTVRDPLHPTFRGSVLGTWFDVVMRDPRSSSAYDRAARELLRAAVRDLARRNPRARLATDEKLEVRRGFQAPCPVRVSQRHRP